MADEFNSIRREAEITSAEFADFCGISRKFAFGLETGRECVTPSLMAALKAMIEQRA